MVARPMRPPSCRQSLEHIICSTMRSDSFLPKGKGWGCEGPVREPKVYLLCVYLLSFRGFFFQLLVLPVHEFDIARLVEGEWSNLWVKKAWKRFFGLTKRCIISASSRGRPGRFVCSLLSGMEFQNFQVPVFWRASWLLNQLSSPRNAPCWEYWPFQSYTYITQYTINKMMSTGPDPPNLSTDHLGSLSPWNPSLHIKSFQRCNPGDSPKPRWWAAAGHVCARTTQCLRTWAHGHLLRSW